MTAARYYVTFRADGFADVTALLDQTPAQVTGGHGGWTVTPRERRIGLTQWHGNDPLRLAIPILFDDEFSDQEVMLAVNTLTRMGLPPAGGGEPPTVQVIGQAIPVTGLPPNIQWAMESLQWGTNVHRELAITSGARATTSYLNRLRQDVIVNLIQYVDEDRVAFSNLPSQAAGVVTGKSKAGWPKSYVVRSGDTLGTIAAHFYKNTTKWKNIAKANNIRDPRSISAGQTLRIPAP